MRDFSLKTEGAALLIIDIQERLANVMKYREEVVKNTLVLVETARTFSLPVFVSEQYPKGLGATVAPLREALPDIQPYEKTDFSAGRIPELLKDMMGNGVKQVVVTGMETHVCVAQTVADLLRSGFEVHVVADAVCSRSTLNWKMGLQRMADFGAYQTTTETVVFELLQRAGTPEFKKLSRLIK